jgi:hypothetical protein
MRNSIIRWTIYLIALFIAGPAAGALVGSVHATDGGPASPLVSASPIAGLVYVLIAMAVALVFGVVGARLLGTGPGMSAAGVVVAWAAWRTADVDQLIRTAHSGGPLTMLAVEGATFGVTGLILAVIIWLFGAAHERKGTGPDTVSASAQSSPDSITGRATEKEQDLAWLVRKMRSGKATLPSIAVGIVVGGVAAWLIAVTPLKGQAVFAAIAAGAFAAAAGRLVDFEAPMPAMFIPILVLAILGPLTGLVLADSRGIVATSYAGRLFPLANVSPLDWIAGGLLGIPLGVSWAGSMIEKRTQEA